MNCLNFSLVNDVPLSVMICFGSPWVEKIDCSFSMVFSTVTDCMIWISRHFEWESTRTKNTWPINDPAKSKCNLLHGCEGHSHEWSGALGGEGLACWQLGHLLATSSMLSSILGHQMYDRARAFILLAPKCVSCSSSSTDFRPGGGTTTLAPHSMHPSRTLSSFLRDVKGLYSSPNWAVGHPCRMYWQTFERVGSLSVHLLMWDELTVVVSKWFSKCTRSPGMQSESVVTLWGKWSNFFQACAY